MSFNDNVYLYDQKDGEIIGGLSFSLTKSLNRT